MASDLQLAVKAIQLNDYTTLVVLTAVGYDYVLTFSKEMEYVWTKPWTRVSTLFLLVRYIGLCFVVWEFFLAWTYKGVCIRGISMLSIGDSPLQSNVAIGVSSALVLLQAWASLIFFGASDLLILRVWASNHRSRKILAALLLLYAIELIPFVIYCAEVSTGKIAHFGIARLPGFSFCAPIDFGAFWPIVIGSLLLMFNSSTCVLVGVQFIQQSTKVYRTKNQYRLDHYFDALVKDGVMYFLAILIYSVITLVQYPVGIPAYEPWTVLLGAVQFVPMITLAPRFILNLRELYACDRKRQLGSELDTAFGLSSRCGHETVASIVFAYSDTRENEGLEGSERDEEISMEDRGIRSAGEGV